MSYKILILSDKEGSIFSDSDVVFIAKTLMDHF
jgi:hypothetical protein